MAKRPTKPAPPRETITGLRAQLAEKGALISHLFDVEEKLKQERDRLHEQSQAVAKILKHLHLMPLGIRDQIVFGCHDILHANRKPDRLPCDEVPF